MVVSRRVLPRRRSSRLGRRRPAVGRRRRLMRGRWLVRGSLHGSRLLLRCFLGGLFRRRFLGGLLGRFLGGLLRRLFRRFLRGLFRGFLRLLGGFLLRRHKLFSFL